MDVKVSILFDKFNTCYTAAQKAYKAGNFAQAKSGFLLAAETMFKLALESEGVLKAERTNKAKQLMEFAQKIDIEAAESRASGDKEEKKAEAKNNSAQSKNDQGKAEVRDREDNTETKWEAAAIPNVFFSDIAGLEDVKQAIRERVIYPKQNPEVYERFKKKMGGGILMYGPPGTGKSMMAKAIAREVNAKFFSIKCSDVVSKWFGEAERNIKNLFECARKEPSAVIFFDEFESLGAKRGGNSTVMNRLIPELLTQIQGFSESDSTLLLVAATNRPWDIDTAFLRPGRFNELLYIPLPDEPARKALIEKAYFGVPLSPDVSIDLIVKATEGFNGADVKEFCERTKNGPIKRSIKSGSKDEVVELSDIEYVKNKVKSSVSQADIRALNKFRAEMNFLD